jgi:Kef-type K+ transport system membrane component KefB
MESTGSTWRVWIVEQGRTFFLYWVLALICWLLMYLSFPQLSLPASYNGSLLSESGSDHGGGIFAFLLLFFAADAAGRFAKNIGVPPLFGMLIMGLILQFLPGMKYKNPVAGKAALPALGESVLNLGVQASFSIVLCRAGMGLDVTALLGNKMRVLAITVIPLLFEFVVGLGLSSAPGLLDFSSPFNVLSGLLISCPSPAIAIPALLSLKELGIGEAN